MTDLDLLQRAASRIHDGSRQTSGDAEPRSNLDLLLDEEGVSFNYALNIIADRQLRGKEAAQSTIDALLYSLRAGATALARDDVQRRIAMLAERQMHDCCKQLQHRNIAKSWTRDEIEKLVALWASCHG